MVFPESINHDATAVHRFNSKMIEYLKSKFGSENVKKLFYFSDGAGSQYKNKYNFVNLLYHERDFGVEAEWHFSATSHGKGAVDGIGGNVKLHARRASIQRDAEHSISTAKKLFDWATNYFQNIDFDFCTEEEHAKHKKLLEARYKTVKTLPNTRINHFYKPINDTQLLRAIFSADTENEIITIVHKPKRAKAKKRLTKGSKKSKKNAKKQKK